MIICDNVSKFVLKNVDLHIPGGTAVGLIGASGAGKTTFLKLAAGLLVPESGCIYSDRCSPVNERRTLIERISVLLADVPAINVDERLSTTFEGIRTIYGIDRHLYAERLKYVSEKLGFAEYMDEYGRDLSLGQKRRAELGTVFVRNSRIYILDEPTIGLDQNGKAALCELIDRVKSSGATVLVASHDMESITAVADRIILLDKGRVSFYGPQDQLYRRFAPSEECTVEFEGNIPDISELETESYEIDNERMVIRYNANHVSSGEVIENILSTARVRSLSIRRPDPAAGIKNAGEKSKKESGE